MTDPRQPHGPLETWGAELRFHRERAGLTQLELGERMNYSDSQISAIELGKKVPVIPFAQAADRALDTGGALERQLPSLEGAAYPEWFRPWPPVEGQASLLRAFHLFTLDGLLQTEAYASAVLGSDEAELTARMQRQSILQRKDPAPPGLRVVLDEFVLHRLVGSREIMRAQLLHLTTCVSPRLSIQVLPNGIRPVVSGSFVLATMPNRSEVAYIETGARALITSERDILGEVQEAWENVRTDALSQHESLELIGRLADELWS